MTADNTLTYLGGLISPWFGLLHKGHAEKLRQDLHRLRGDLTLSETKPSIHIYHPLLSPFNVPRYPPNLHDPRHGFLNLLL